MGIMMEGVLRMPYEMAMADELSRLQFYSRAQEALDELQRLRAENEAMKRDAEWISVEDRLPDNDIRVLVLRDAGKVSNKMHPGYGDGRWVEVSTLMLGNVFLCDMSSTGKTTHWRPLPSAPGRAIKG